ncbi:unnamed protein product [Coregonus sp. 'balchen']|nr:unnamed protein product [Coregonus sp. 'balchen']
MEINVRIIRVSMDLGSVVGGGGQNVEIQRGTTLARELPMIEASEERASDLGDTYLIDTRHSLELREREKDLLYSPLFLCEIERQFPFRTDLHLPPLLLSSPPSPPLLCSSESKLSRLAQRLNQRPGDALIKDFRQNFYSVSMTQQMQNLQLSQTRKCSGGPASPSAAKRLYRNLSEKLKGGHSSFEDAYFFGRGDRHGHRKGSAVEQQDLDAVQILLYQYTAEELDLSTPNSQGLTPLDIAIMTNNTPIAKLLLKAGAKESPHCECTLRRAH